MDVVMWQPATANTRLKAHCTGPASSQKMFTDAPLPRCQFFPPDFEKHVKVTESVYQTRERFSDLKSVTSEVMQYHFNHLYFNCL